MFSVRESTQMALSRLLQQNSALRVCRLGFSAARTRFCSDSDIDSPPQLKEEAVGEDAKIMSLAQIAREAVEVELDLPKATSPGNVMAGYGGPHKPKTLSDIFLVHNDVPTETMVNSRAVEMELDLPKAISPGNVMAGYGGPHKPKTLSDIFLVHNDVPTETKAVNEEMEHEETLLDYLDRSERDECPSQSNGWQKGLDIKYLLTTSADDLAALGTDRPRNLASIYPSSDHSNEPHEDDAEKHSAEGLVECITLQSVASNPTKDCSSTGLIKDDSVHSNVERSDEHDGLNLLTFPAGTSTMVTSKSGFDAIDLIEQKEGQKDSLPISNKDQKQKQRKNSARTKSEGNKVVVRFLRSFITKSQIFETFSSCGEILKIECPDSQGLQFKTSYIDFKTTEGVEKAISRSGSQFFGPIIVESATSENRTTMISVPSLLGDPDMPAALVKNPTRTIRIEQLTQEMSSHHIVEALSFCNSNISGYFLGSSHYVAYVEFETEIGKERALAKQSINVMGRHLVILRIDCPRTTAVRISSRGSMEKKDVMSLCKSLGNISSSKERASNVLDVEFKLAEWPNMLKILNRLNGCIVEGMPLQAAPAPIFPPEVLLALWRHPEERKHLKATAQALLHKLDGTLDTSELAFLENELFST